MLPPQHAVVWSANQVPLNSCYTQILICFQLTIHKRQWVDSKNKHLNSKNTILAVVVKLNRDMMLFKNPCLEFFFLAAKRYRRPRDACLISSSD